MFNVAEIIFEIISVFYSYVTTVVVKPWLHVTKLFWNSATATWRELQRHTVIRRLDVHFSAIFFYNLCSIKKT